MGKQNINACSECDYCNIIPDKVVPYKKTYKCRCFNEILLSLKPCDCAISKKRSEWMEKSEIKKVFRDYLPTLRAYRLTIEKAKRIESDVQALKAVVITGMPHGSGVSDPVANAVCKLHEAAERVKVAAEKYAEQIRLYESIIALVSDPLGDQVIRLRWEQDIDFDYIPSKIHASRRTMFRHYNAALDEIYEKTKDGTKWH